MIYLPLEMKRIVAAGFAVLAFAATPEATAGAQDKSRIPPQSLYQTMLDANRQTGWIQFRNFDSSQWIYFTALQTLHCRLAEIRYSINSKQLDETFDLVECNPQNPWPCRRTRVPRRSR